MYNEKHSKDRKGLGSAQEYCNVITDNKSIPLKHLTNNGEKIIDIVLMGYDWVNETPVVFSVQPEKFNKLFPNSSKLSNLKTAALQNIKQRPSLVMNAHLPVNGWATDSRNLPSLNSLLKPSYGAVASNVQNAVDSGIVKLNTIWTNNDYLYSGVQVNKPISASRFFALYYSADIPNTYSRYGYRFPNALNPNASENWVVTSQANNKLLSCFKVMYLTENDWVLNFSKKDDNGKLELQKTELPNIQYLAANSTNYYAQHPQVFLSNCITTNNRLYAGQALYSNDLRYKAYLDITGSLDIFKLPFNENNILPNRSAYSLNSNTISANSYLRYYLAVQSDGNLVLYQLGELDDTGKTQQVWATGTDDPFSNNSELKLVLEAGGILVAYIAGYAAKKFDTPVTPLVVNKPTNVYGKINNTNSPSTVPTTLRKIQNIHNVVATNNYNGINLKNTNNRFDPQCVHYWNESNEKNSKLITDIINNKCYINPRLQYEFRNNKVTHKYAKFQTMVWLDGGYNNINLDYVYDYKDGLFKKYFEKYPDKLKFILVQYCSKGDRWVNGECANIAIKSSKSNAPNYLTDLIDYDITNRICVNPPPDGINFCEYIRPSDKVLLKLISRNPEFKGLNMLATISSYKYNNEDKLDIVNKHISKYNDLSEEELIFLQQFYNSNKGIKLYSNWLIAYSKCMKRSVPSVYKIPDYNLSFPPDQYDIYPYYVVFKSNNKINLAVSNYDLYSLLALGSETKSGNKTYKQSDNIWKGLTVSIQNKLFNYYNVQPITANEVNGYFSKTEKYLFANAYDTQIWNLLSKDEKSSVPIYVLKIKSTKAHFLAIHQANNMPILPIPQNNKNNFSNIEHMSSSNKYNANEVCTKNPDWCFNEYNTYVNNVDNYGTTEFNNICDSLVFNPTNKNIIQKSCSTTYGIVNASKPEYRYSTKSAPSIRTIATDYQPLWESSGCTTSLKTQPAGSTSTNPKRYDNKDYWDSLPLSQVTNDILEWSSLSTPSQRTVCKGNPRPAELYQKMFNKLGCSVNINTISAGSSQSNPARYGVKDLWDAQEINYVTNDMINWRNTNPEKCFGNNLNTRDQQLIWNAIGCTTDISKQSIGSSSKDSSLYVLKDLWNGKSSTKIHNDMLAISQNTKTNAMCYGKSKFNNKFEGFSGGSCVTFCEDPNISKEMQIACDKGAINYCKSGSNVFSANCAPFIVKFPDLQKHKLDYCGLNPLDNKNCSNVKSNVPVSAPVKLNLDVVTTPSKVYTALTKVNNISAPVNNNNQLINSNSKYLFLSLDIDGNIIINNSPLADVEWDNKNSVKNKSYSDNDGPKGVQLYSDAAIFKYFKDDSSSGSLKLNSYGKTGKNSIASVVALPDESPGGDYKVDTNGRYLYRDQKSGNNFIFKVLKKIPVPITPVDPTLNGVLPTSNYIFLNYKKDGTLAWNNSPNIDIQWITKNEHKDLNYVSKSGARGVEFKTTAKIFDEFKGHDGQWNSFGTTGLNSEISVRDIPDNYVIGFEPEYKYKFMFRNQPGPNYIFKVFKRINRTTNQVNAPNGKDNYLFVTYDANKNIMIYSLPAASTDFFENEQKQNILNKNYTYNDGPLALQFTSGSDLFKKLSGYNDKENSNSYGTSGNNTIKAVTSIPDNYILGFTTHYMNPYVYKNRLLGKDFIFKVFKRNSYIPKVSKFTNLIESMSQPSATDIIYYIISFILFILLVVILIRKYKSYHTRPNWSDKSIGFNKSFALEGLTTSYADKIN
jgi:hypothetical protein